MPKSATAPAARDRAAVSKSSDAPASSSTASPAPRITLFDIPEFAVAMEKLTALEGQRGQLVRRQGDLEAEWSLLVSDHPEFQSLAGISIRNAERHAKALALVNGEEAGTAKVSSRFAEIRTELTNIEEELEILRRAVALQEPIVDRARTKAAQAVCRHLFPEHQAIVQRLAEAALALEDAVKAHREFARWLECEEIPASGPIAIAGIARVSSGDLRVPIGNWISLVREFGYDVVDRNAKQTR